jgi:Cof subfamily protein (haloacid dehalogenase superfamily)
MKIVFTDLDGTLLNSDSNISQRNIDSLYKLKEKNIKIVAVTGRNIYSSKKALTKDLPFDYVIFSTGIGIYDFISDKIIYSHSFSKCKSQKLSKFLYKNNLNFFAHKLAPDNHFSWYKYSYFDKDFNNRLNSYKNYTSKISIKNNVDFVSHFLIILPFDDVLFDELKNKTLKKIVGIKIIRATSPVDFNHIWFEIYPKNISKGHTALRLCKILNIPISECVAIGNDYNDIDLLDIAGKSFILANAPNSLLKKYHNVSSNDEDGFAEAVDLIL